MDSDFYLIQRLSPGTRPQRTGFDSAFDLEYMGSAEYEYGAPGNSLRRIRKEGAVKSRAVDLTVDGLTRLVHLIAPPQRLSAASDELHRWAHAARPFRSMELNYFSEVFAGTPRAYVRTIAWWSFDCDVMWTLETLTADRLVSAVNTSPKVS